MRFDKGCSEFARFEERCRGLTKGNEDLREWTKRESLFARDGAPHDCCTSRSHDSKSCCSDCSLVVLLLIFESCFLSLFIGLDLPF